MTFTGREQGSKAYDPMVLWWEIQKNNEKYKQISRRKSKKKIRTALLHCSLWHFDLKMVTPLDANQGAVDLNPASFAACRSTA